MTPFSCAHTHTNHVDGRDTMEAMALAAISQGFISLGFSEHARQDFDTAYALSEEGERAYLSEFQGIQKAYRKKIALYCGIERDALSVADRSMFDYVIGSVHYVDYGGQRVAVDGGREELRLFVEKQLGGDGLMLAKLYYERLGEYVAAYKPDIIGHFDLVCKHNAACRFFDESSPAYRRLAHAAMEQAIAGCALMEVNTGAMARSGAAFPYPSPALLRRWRALGGRVTLASDCHNSAQLSFGYQKGLDMIREAGFTEIWYLNDGHGGLFAPYPL